MIFTFLSNDGKEFAFFESIYPFLRMCSRRLPSVKLADPSECSHSGKGKPILGNATGILTKFYQNLSAAPQELSSSVTEVSFEGTFTKKKIEALPLPDFSQHSDKILLQPS